MSKLTKLFRNPWAFFRDSQFLKKITGKQTSAQKRRRKDTLGPAGYFWHNAHFDLGQLLHNRSEKVCLYFSMQESPITGFFRQLHTQGKSIDLPIIDFQIMAMAGSPWHVRNLTNYVTNHPDLWQRSLCALLQPYRMQISAMVLTNTDLVMRETARVCQRLGIKVVLLDNISFSQDEQHIFTDYILTVSHQRCEDWQQLGLSENCLINVADTASVMPEMLPSEDIATYIGLPPVAQHMTRWLLILPAELEQHKGWHVKLLILIQLLERNNIFILLWQEKVDLVNIRHFYECRYLVVESLASCPLGLNKIKSLCQHHFVCLLSSQDEVEDTRLPRFMLNGEPDIWESQIESVLAKEVSPPSDINVSMPCAMKVSAALKHIAEMPSAVICDPLQDLLYHPQPSCSYVINIPNAQGLSTIQKHLGDMLGGAKFITAQTEMEMSKADIAMQWGITPTKRKVVCADLARRLGRSLLIVEDGFIRSLDIGLSREPGLSITLDDCTAYYNARQPSRLNHILNNSEFSISSEQLQYVRSVIDRIVKHKISKYNHAPLDIPTLGRSQTSRILLIDQRFGDQSVYSGMASEEDYLQMLEDALALGTQWDVIIKRHPDAIKGGKQSYFSNEVMAPYLKKHKNIILVDYNINLFSLMSLVERVSVVTSGAGFEALMAGKQVDCYGVPFYAGWGLTHDHKTPPYRYRQRSLEEVFFVAYILLSRYYDPFACEICDVDRIIDVILRMRDHGERPE